MFALFRRPRLAKPPAPSKPRGAPRSPTVALVLSIPHACLARGVIVVVEGRSKPY